jgi:hypothetical protein
MRHGNWMIVAMAAVVLPACDRVESTVPMGLEPATLSPEDWDGLWLGDEGVVAITVTDEIAGKLTVSVLEQTGRSATPPHELETAEATVRRSGDWLFANFPSDESPNWAWVRVKLEGDRLIGWGPSAAAFRSLVSRGLLPGRIDDVGGSMMITLDPLTPAQDQMIRSGSEGVLMDWESPVVLVRIRAPARRPPPPQPVPRDSVGS